jgi:hypothetical protein
MNEKQANKEELIEVKILTGRKRGRQMIERSLEKPTHSAHFHRCFWIIT